MKLLSFISHPVTLISSFSIIMISGEHLGGFYALYILLGLYGAAVHSLLGVAGVAILLISYYKFKRKNQYLIEPLLNLIGLVLLILSLYLFFYNDKSHYNYGTFYQTVPLISLSLFGLLALCFFIDNVRRSVSKKNLPNMLLN